MQSHVKDDHLPDGYLVFSRPIVTVAYACARAGCPAVVPAAEAVRLADGERYCQDCARRPDTGRSRLDEHRATQAAYRRDARARDCRASRRAAASTGSAGAPTWRARKRTRDSLVVRSAMRGRSDSRARVSAGAGRAGIAAGPLGRVW